MYVGREIEDEARSRANMHARDRKVGEGGLRVVGGYRAAACRGLLERPRLPPF